MTQYPSSTSIQQFQRLENVSSDLMNLFYTTTTESLNAYFPISPCIMSGINDISNNYGQIGTSNVFEFAAGAVRFPNQITVIPGSIIEEFTWAPYAGASITLSGITDGTIYYCVANLTQIANDSYKVTNTMTILDTAVTASGLNDQNVALFAITSNAGIYTVFLDSNCAYNYGDNNQIQSDFNRNNNLGSATTYTISLSDAFSLLSNDGVSIAYTLPSYLTLPLGTTVCIQNQNGTISTAFNTITMTSAYSNMYYKCEVGTGGWIIDGQLMGTYSQWATQAYVTATTQKYYSLLITATGTWVCPANVTQIYVTLIGGGGGGGGAGNGNNGGVTIAFGLTANGGFGGGVTDGPGGAGGIGGRNSSSRGAGNSGGSAGSAISGNGGTGGSTWIACSGEGTNAGLPGGNASLGGGGGGTGGSTSATNWAGAGGGSSGELQFKKLVSVTPGNTYTITIGIGGTGSSGSSTFGAGGSGGSGAVLIEY